MEKTKILPPIEDNSWQKAVLRISKTLLACLGYAIFGIIETSKGPALLDFSELLNVNLDVVSYYLIFETGGSLLGTFGSGLITDKLTLHRYFHLAFYLSVLALTTGFLTYSSLYMFFVLCFIGGTALGAISCAINVLVLDIWRGHGGELWMHLLHFCFAGGAFLGPIIVKPFLSSDGDEFEEQEANVTLIIPTLSQAQLKMQSNGSVFGIQTLYPVLASVTALVSMMLLGMGVYTGKDPASHQELKNPYKENLKQDMIPEASSKADTIEGRNRIKALFTSLMVTYFALYVGMETMYGMFVAVFSVKSKLRLSKQDGANVAAIFFGSFAVLRFMAIFLSLKFKSLHLLSVSHAMSLICATVLAVMGQSNSLVLYNCSAFLGAGMAPIYASGMLWMEEQMIITGKIGSLIVIAMRLGGNMFPLILGQTITTTPMILMYMNLVGILGCVALFMVSFAIKGRLPKKLTC